MGGRTPTGSRVLSITLKQGEDVYVIQNPAQENVLSSGEGGVGEDEGAAWRHLPARTRVLPACVMMSSAQNGA